jgi:hypothetical protein
MGATICGLTVDNFFAYWLTAGSNFILAKDYDPNITYNTNDIVYYGQVPYISLVDGNVTPPLPMNVPPLWNQIALNSRSLPVQPGMVASAMQSAQSDFNYQLFPQAYGSNNQPVQYNATPPVDTLTGYTNAQIGFIILASHYLCCDLFAGQFGGQASSVNSGTSVGGMSQSFKFPSNIEKSRIFARENTEYGRKYNQMTAPFERAETAPSFFYSNR